MTRSVAALRGLAAILVLVVASILGIARASAAATPRHPVVLVGTGGFTWSDVSQERTPVLWNLMMRAALSTVTVRSVHTNTCPIDGWLSFSAGDRAAAAEPDGSSRRPVDQGCPPVPDPKVSDPPQSVSVPGWAGYRHTAEQAHFTAKPGAFGDALAAAGIAVTAIGPGAAVGAARSDGSVAAYLPLESALDGGAVPAAPVTLVDLGSVRDPADLGAGERAPGGSVDQQLRELDGRLERLLPKLPADADLIVAGLSDGGRTARLRPVLAIGPDYGAGLLWSPSTRQPLLIQASDLMVTVLDRAGARVPTGSGGAVVTVRPAGSQPAFDRYDALTDLDLATFTSHALVPPFFTALLAAQLLIYAGMWLLSRRRAGNWPVQVVRAVAVATATVPLASFLADLFPWWRRDPAMPALVAAVAVFVVAITALALARPVTRHLLGPAAVVAAATALGLGADVITGSRLQLTSMMGLQPVVGGRFYGMGNVTFALFITAILWSVLSVASPLVRRGRPRAAALTVAAIGALAVIVDGSPAWGADGGGPPAFLPALAYLVLAVLGIRLRGRTVALIAAGTVGAVMLVGFLDSLRAPDKQTHLGRFFEGIGTGAAYDTIVRKASTNVHNLVASPLTLLVPVAFVFVVYVLLRPTALGSGLLVRAFAQIPLLRPTLLAWIVVMVLGFALNDSGVAIPATGAMIAVPLLLATTLSVLLCDRARGDAAGAGR